MQGGVAEKGRAVVLGKGQGQAVCGRVGVEGKKKVRARQHTLSVYECGQGR